MFGILLILKILFLIFLVLLNRFSKFVEKCIPVIKPNQKIKLIWDLIIILIISVYFLIIPMQLSFAFFYDNEFEEFCAINKISHSISKIILTIPELILITDTLLKFITGFYLDGVIITKKSTIVEHYLKKGLVLDLIAYCPVIIQGIIRKELKNVWFFNATTIRIMQLLIFCKLKRVLMALSNFQEIAISNGKNDYLLNAFRLILTVSFITHLTACALHAIAYFNTEINESWLYTSGLYTAPWATRYWASIYWSISMMATIGFNEKISPANTNEYIFGVIALAVTITLFGYTINCFERNFQ